MDSEKKKELIKVLGGSAFAGFCVTQLLVLTVSLITSIIVNSSLYQYFFSQATAPQQFVLSQQPRGSQELRTILDTLAPHISASERTEIVKSASSVAHDFQVDPLFLFAVMYEESRFQRGAVSSKGAQGLMQIMPETGEYVEAELLGSGLRSSSLFQISHNLLIGTRYLTYLAERFKNDWFHVLVAYNWGPTRLQRALQNGKPIPGSVQGYAQRVMERYTLLSSEVGWSV